MVAWQPLLWDPKRFSQGLVTVPCLWVKKSSYYGNEFFESGNSKLFANASQKFLVNDFWHSIILTLQKIWQNKFQKRQVLSVEPNTIEKKNIGMRPCMGPKQKVLRLLVFVWKTKLWFRNFQKKFSCDRKIQNCEPENWLFLCLCLGRSKNYKNIKKRNHCFTKF